MVNTVFLNPLPVANPSELVVVYTVDENNAAATWASNPPLFGGFQRSVFIEGRPDDEAGVLLMTNGIDVGYFDIVSTPLVRGRDFTATDRQGSVPVVIVNEEMAADFWPGADALGKPFRFYGDDFYREIVGIARTSKYQTLGEDPLPMLYIPWRQSYRDALVLHVRGEGDPSSAVVAARELLRESDPTVPVTNSWTMAEVVDPSLWAPHGAGRRPADVLGLVLKQPMTLVGIGTVAGRGLSFAVSSRIATILYGSARDPLTFLAVPATLGLVALVASLVPALRASRVDPLSALRYL